MNINTDYFTCTLSLSHALTLDMLNNFCFHVYAQNLLSHFLTLTLSLFLTLTLFQSQFQTWSLDYLITWSLDHLITWLLDHLHSLIHSLSTCWISFVFISMLKSHCLLAKIAMLFFDIILIIITLSCDTWVHRAGSQLKNTYKKWPKNG